MPPRITRRRWSAGSTQPVPQPAAGAYAHRGAPSEPFNAECRAASTPSPPTREGGLIPPAPFPQAGGTGGLGMHGEHVGEWATPDGSDGLDDRRAPAPHRVPHLRSASGHSDPLGDGGGLDAAADPQLAKNVGDVDARRLVRDVQLGADLPVGAAGGHEGEDLSFACGQA